MAFSDSVANTQNSVLGLLNLRRQRKEGLADRLTGTGQNIAGMMFQGQQSEKDREAREALARLPYEDFEEPKTIVDPATGEEVTLSRPADFDLASAMFGGIRQGEEMEFTDAQRQKAQEDALARMQEESKLNIEEYDEQTLNQIELMQEDLKNQQAMIDWERAKFDNGMYQTQDGAIFTWEDPETYQAALDEINRHTQKLATMSSRNPTVWDVYKDATDRAKEQMWEPYYDDEGLVRWRRTEVTQDTLLENFVSELPMTQMGPQDQENAIEAFRTYLINAENSPPQEFSEAGDSTTVTTTSSSVNPLIRPDIESEEVTVGPTAEGYTSPYTEESEQVLGENAGFKRFLLNALNLPAGEAVMSLQDDYYPEGITPAPTDFSGREVSSGSAEQRLYDRLMRLVSEGEATEEEVRPFIETMMQEERESYPDIDAFLRRAGVSTGATGGF